MFPKVKHLPDCSTMLEPCCQAAFCLPCFDFHGKRTPLCRTKKIHDKEFISNVADEGMGSPKPF